MNWWALGIVVILLAVALSHRRRERADGFVESLGQGSQPPTDADIDVLLAAGRKIDAIKAYRAIHVVDLKTAKDAVEARARQLPGGS